MKLITAIIQPFMLDKLARTLLRAPVTGFTVVEARGFGRGTTDSTGYLVPRTQVEIAVADKDLETVKNIVLKTVGTQQDGDGVVLVSELLEAIYIQSGKSLSQE